MTPQRCGLHIAGLYPPGEKPPYRCKKLIPGMTMNENGTLSFPESRKSQGPSPEMLFIQANMRNEVSFPLAKRFRIPIIHTYNQTAMLHEFHRDNGHGYECTHFCFPVPGIWIYSFVKTLCAPPPRPLSLLELLLEWVGL